MKGTIIIILFVFALTNSVLATILRGNSDPSQAPAICAAAGSNSILVAHEDCSKFYKCFQGKPVAIDCPDSLLYNPDREYCDWPENVNCKKVNDKDGDKDTPVDTESPKGNSDPSQAKEICSAEGSDGVLIAHEDCSKFYMCSENRPAALSCPLNLLYNPEKEQCDWPDNVQCEANNKEENPEQQREEEDESQVEVAEICAADGSDSKLLAHKVCSKFYICSGGRPIVLDCPKSLLYNPLKKYCDWPENVNC